MKQNKFSADHKSENVLVTGGGGFLGRAIIRRLVDRGDHVSSLSRNAYADLKAMGVDQIQGDIADLARGRPAGEVDKTRGRVPAREQAVR